MRSESEGIALRRLPPNSSHEPYFTVRRSAERAANLDGWQARAHSLAVKDLVGVKGA